VATRILIVDDSPAIRDAVRSCLEHYSNVEICGEAEDGRDAVRAAYRLHPDVVILDVSMPRMNGLDAAREMVNFTHRPAIVLFTALSRSELPRDIRQLGITSVISKNDSGVIERLRASVREAADANPFPA